MINWYFNSGQKKLAPQNSDMLVSPYHKRNVALQLHSGGLSGSFGISAWRSTGVLQLLVGFKSPLPFLEEPRRCFFRCLLVRRHLLDLNGFLHDNTNPSVKSNSSQLMISHSIMKMKRRLEFIALSFVNDSREQSIFYRCVCLLMWIVFSSLYVNAELV